MFSTETKDPGHGTPHSDDGSTAGTAMPDASANPRRTEASEPIRAAVSDAVTIDLRIETAILKWHFAKTPFERRRAAREVDDLKAEQRRIKEGA